MSTRQAKEFVDICNKLYSANLYKQAVFQMQQNKVDLSDVNSEWLNSWGKGLNDLGRTVSVDLPGAALTGITRGSVGAYSSANKGIQHGINDIKSMGSSIGGTLSGWGHSLYGNVVGGGAKLLGSFMGSDSLRDWGSKEQINQQAKALKANKDAKNYNYNLNKNQSISDKVQDFSTNKFLDTYFNWNLGYTNQGANANKNNIFTGMYTNGGKLSTPVPGVTSPGTGVAKTDDQFINQLQNNAMDSYNNTYGGVNHNSNNNGTGM